MFRRTYGNLRSPWPEMDRLQREMNQLFAGASRDVRRVAPAYPAMNMWTGKESAIVTAELPGVDAEDIDISVVGDTLTLTGDRKPDRVEEGGSYHRRERGHGKFTRAFELPFQVDSDQVEATFTNGVLRITLPAIEAEKPKKVIIKAG